MNDYKVNTGITIVPFSAMPENTIYCSYDIYRSLLISCNNISEDEADNIMEELYNQRYVNKIIYKD